MLNIMLLFETNLYMLNCCLYIYPMFSNFKKPFRRSGLTFEGALTFEGGGRLLLKGRLLSRGGRLLLKGRLLSRGGRLLLKGRLLSRGGAYF